MAEINNQITINKEKFWQEKPEKIRVLLPHDNGGILKIFSNVNMETIQEY